MTTYPLRDASSDDDAALAGVFRRASLANPGDRAALLAHPDALVWTAPRTGAARCRVATDGPEGPPVGFATTRALPGAHGRRPTLELEDLFVDPSHWRHGIARRLVDDLVDAARSAGADGVEVDANPHARAFYEATGFVVVGEVATEFGPGLRMRHPA